jgi:hypothetical protein
MWECSITGLDAGLDHYVPRWHGAPVSYAEAIGLWQGDAAFCSYISSLLADSPLRHFRWETPAVTEASARSCDFEFVLVDAPELDRPADRGPFSQYFSEPADGRDVVAVPNLGRDCVMVIPRPRAPSLAYGDLAGFVRHAPADQQMSLWRLVGRSMQERLSGEPVWLSTAGAGVAWLHVRLDDRPKYYRFAPYWNFR